MDSQVLLTFIIVARNAQEVLPPLFGDLLSQTYEKKQTQLLLCDSMSTDETEKVFSAFCEAHRKEYAEILCLKNPGENLPCGWNVCLREAKGELILRVDAHSRLPQDFMEKNVATYLEGHPVVGGHRISMAQKESAWQNTLLVAERSLFGSGLAFYRRADVACETDTVAHGAYSRKVFETVGGYDERLFRTEDNEMHERIRKAGFHIWMNPEIVSKQCARSSLVKMIRQKCANGYWIGLTMGVAPKCISLFHFVPFAFVLGLLFSLMLACFGFPLLLWLCLGAYCLADLMMTLAAFIGEKPFSFGFFLLPFIFFALHLAYGIGTLAGFVYLPFWKRKAENRTCAAKEEVRLKLIQNGGKQDE